MARKFDLNVAGLAKAMKSASLALRKPRQERADMVRQLTGVHYAEHGAPLAVPVNLLALYTQIVGPSLIANNPRVMLSTFDQAAKPTVRAEELWVNQQITRQRLNVGLRRTVTNALFSVGVGKVALATPYDSLRYSWLLKAGQPYYADVSPDDWLYDVHARDFDEVGWMGHRLRVPLDAIRDSKLYKKSVREQATGQPDALYNPEGDERAGVISRGYYSDGTEFEDMCTVWEIYLPRHRAVVTLLADDAGGVDVKEEPLEEKSWVGPDCGPYHVLGYGTVPDNAMPISPLANVLDLHLAVNNCYRKLIWQAQNIKNLTVYPATQAGDADKIRLASNGELVPLSGDPKAVVPLTMNQPDQTLLGVAEALKNLFDFMGNNLALQGGLGPQSKTAHQDEMLNENASRVSTDRQNATKDFVVEVVRAQMWYYHHHPTQDMQAHEPIPGLAGAAVPRRASPAQRQGVDFESLDVRVDPYSLVHKTPQQRLQDVNGVVTGVVLPMMQLLVQQGVQFDIEAYLKKVGDWLAEPDLADILTLAEPPEQAQGGGGGTMPGPANTTRTYERVSRPGTTPQGDARDRIAKLMNTSNGQGQLRPGVGM